MVTRLASVLTIKADHNGTRHGPTRSRCTQGFIQVSDGTQQYGRILQPRGQPDPGCPCHERARTGTGLAVRGDIERVRKTTCDQEMGRLTRKW